MEDWQIVELYLKRSERSIQESRLKYGKLCNRIAFNILRCKEDTEECEVGLAIDHFLRGIDRDSRRIFLLR